MRAAAAEGGSWHSFLRTSPPRTLPVGIRSPALRPRSPPFGRMFLSRRLSGHGPWNRATCFERGLLQLGGAQGPWHGGSCCNSPFPMLHRVVKRVRGWAQGHAVGGLLPGLGWISGCAAGICRGLSGRSP